jgi:hypothetical protein
LARFAVFVALLARRRPVRPRYSDRTRDHDAGIALGIVAVIFLIGLIKIALIKASA